MECTNIPRPVGEPDASANLPIIPPKSLFVILYVKGKDINMNIITERIVLLSISDEDAIIFS